MSPQCARLAIVVVNYGSHELLRSNLVPVGWHTPEAAVVVVDNLSTPQNRDAVRALCQEQGWDLVEPDRNLGFGAGVNLGVERSRELGADGFLLLNPDAAIDADSLRLMWRAVQEDPLALVVPVGRRPDGMNWPTTHLLDLERGSLTPPSAVASQRRGSYWRWVSGACMLLSEELWVQLGGFSAEYFLYWEDIDLAYRTEELGGRLCVLPDAVVVHAEGGTQSVSAAEGWNRSEAYYYYNIRNRLVFAARNLPSEHADRWARWALPAAYNVLSIGGRRKFLRPWRPAAIAYRGIRDGRRYLRASRR